MKSTAFIYFDHVYYFNLAQVSNFSFTKQYLLIDFSFVYFDYLFSSLVTDIIPIDHFLESLFYLGYYL